ncbi:DUF4390 domain-containing protein [Ramlibacter sp. XY19]|uniref:DUF4390 domain-containing protein n=1 Tax=Ramlibacter paludis TaxID=2908000 RepID=UPI0023DB6A68|nr:DUF4390 domain-containing protein [Ramlibacter paludis]MCG2595434.1 DUF4390 domain-containing protein [Ramlibacter paludis]
MLERAAFACAFVFFLLATALAPARADVGATEITHMQVERGDEGILLSATVKFDLPPVIEDALAKGIPMYFVAEAAIYRDRWYWYDKRVSYAARHMRLAFQPLTRRWRLQVSPNPIGNSGMVLGQMFDTHQEALAAIQRTSRWRIADNSTIDPDSTQTVEFRFRLDVSQLPRPFQIGAVGQSEWNINAARAQRLELDAAR